MAFPVEHVGGIGLGLVVPVRGRRDPGNRLGNAVVVGRILVGHFGDPFPEHTKGYPGVLVRLLVVIGSTDPEEDLLGSLPVTERIGQPADLLGEDRAVSEQFLSPLIGIFRRAPTVNH